MSYTQWVSNGTNVSYVPKEKDTGEVITPFTTTAPGGVPNSSYAPSTYVLAASGAWIPQTVGTSSSEVRRPTAYTLLTSNPSPYFEATDTSLVYDSDTNHLTTNGRFELQGLSAQNDASFKFSSFQTKAQTWTSATLNISRNYASTRWTSGTEARYYLSTDGGTNWTLLLTDDYDNDPVTVTIFSHTLATSNPSSLSNYQVKVEIDAFSSGALGSVGVLDLQLYDIWIEGIYTVSGGSGTVTSITTTGANGVTISGGSTQTITTSGTFALALGNITPTSISTGTGSFSGDVEFAASIKSPNGSNSPVTIVPDGTGDLHVNADSLRLGDNNANATIATNGTGDLILTTHEGSATEGVIRLYDGANGNITLTPNGTGQVQVGSDQVVTLTASQTLTNKTLSSNSVWNGNVIGSAYGGAGTVNGILKANGSGTVSAASAGTDYVTSVSVTSPVSNTGTTANPTIALASGYGDTQNPYGSKTANYFLASPNGSAGVPTWRSIVAADIPTLNQNTTGTAANITATSNTTLTTLSSLVSIGTITTGTWNASAIGVAYGGTGLTTLTAGYIPYGNGTSAFGSSANLFWDSTNSRLGIGTSSPRAKLETSGSIFATSRSIPTGGAGPEIWWSGTVSGISSYDRTNSAYKPLLLEAEYSYFTTANGSEQMRINNTGVGIGTTTPSQKLEVANGYSLFGGLRINGADASVNQIWQSNSGTNLGIMANGGAILFGQTSSEQMRLTASGSLGIGTTNPVYKVQIEPTTVTAGGVNNLLRIGTQSTTTGTTSRFSMFCSTDPVNDTNGGKVFIDAIRTATNMDLAFSLNNTGGAAPVERMRLTGEGNLGIGKTPSYKLDVNGTINGTTFYSNGYTLAQQSSSYIQLFRQDGGIGIFLGGADPANYYDNTTHIFRDRSSGEYARINSTGLGIGGTASTGTRLYVVGSNTTSNTSIPIYANQVYGNTGVSSAAIRLNLNDGAGGCYLYGYSGGAGFMHNAEYLAGTGWTARSTFASIMETTSSGFSFYLNSSLTAGNTFTPSERMRITSTEVKATVPFIGNSGTKGFGAVTTTTSTSTPTGGSSGDHYYIY